jgi:uncharacterized membrane protein
MTATDPGRTTRTVLGVLFGGAGIAHFAKREFFDQLVPGSLAAYRTAISFGTGILQIVGAVTMFIPGLRSVARWTNLALLVPTLPPAVDQIRHPETLRRVGIPPQLAPVRVLAQLLVIAATWRSTRPAQGGQA